MPALLAAGTGVVWVDVARPDDDVLDLLRATFRFHPLALSDSARRNPMPKLHSYPDHAFLVLHAPERGLGGHMHSLELDQFIGPGYLVTVHGPLNPALDPRIALTETDAVRARLDAGRLRPGSGHELAAAIAAAVVRRLQRHLEELTAEVWELERTVTSGHFGDAEQFLEEMFRVRHGLLSVATMATLDHQVYERLTQLADVADDRGRELALDVVDRFARIATMAESQRAYIQGVIEFYQTRTNTKMTIAAERLAVIAGVTLPVTALSSVLGMNVIVSDETHWPLLILLLAVMAAMSVAMLVWARRKGWW
ncbi:magnesium/cobalt transporter CorA [Pseudonocardia ailaonensis]|uniref:Magnesium/cobalt transporter CorA n=1 Tax=Pseudonocardia ailaonensis TaxID=367279 RepID=A0ABN2N698_9PSEU